MNIHSLFNIYWDNHMGFFFQFVYMMNYIERFVYVELSRNLCDAAYLIMVDVLFNVFLNPKSTITNDNILANSNMPAVTTSF